VAFRHENGEGYNVLLQAMPLDGKLVMRLYKETTIRRRTVRTATTRSKRPLHDD
jgi:hypothetical protein